MKYNATRIRSRYCYNRFVDVPDEFLSAMRADDLSSPWGCAIHNKSGIEFRLPAPTSSVIISIDTWVGSTAICTLAEESTIGRVPVTNRYKRVIDMSEECSIESFIERVL